MYIVYLSFTCSLLFMFVAEKLFPAREQDNLFKHNTKNLLLGLVWFVSFSFLPILQNFQPFTLFGHRPHLDWKVAFVLGVVILDFTTYWWHRFNHSNSFYRKVHWIHHSDSRVNFSTTLRFHYVELATYYALKLLICAVFQIPLVVLLFYDSLTFSNGLFHHSNIKLNPLLERILRTFLVTPSFHLNHHSSEPKYANSNYGSFLVVWDKLFGTYSVPHEPKKIGLGTAEQKTFFALCLRPFQSKIKKTESSI